MKPLGALGTPRWRAVVAFAGAVLLSLFFCRGSRGTHHRASAGSVDVRRQPGVVSVPPALLPLATAPRKSLGGTTPATNWFHTRPEEAPTWTVGFGREFWRSTPAALMSPVTGATTNRPSMVNAGEVVERVAHAFLPDETTGEPVVNAANYRAVFTATGLRFAQKGSAATSSSGEGEAALVFQTSEVTRGEHELSGAEPASGARSALGNTAQRLLGPDVVEHYEARGNGVSVTWVLNQPPPGNGPLNIAARVTGLDYAGQTPGGHHYADADGVARARIGEVVAVDQAGRRWPLSATATEHTLAITVPAAALVEAQYPLAIDPLISPEFGVDNPVLSDPVSGSAASVASNGEGYLVTWFGTRAGPGVWGARLSTTGDLLDPAGFLIDSGDKFRAFPDFWPAVASNGQDYLVAWFGTAGVTAKRVLADGRPVGASRSKLAPSRSPWFVTLASNGSEYLVVWKDLIRSKTQFNDPDFFGLFGARVDNEGALLPGAGFLIGTNTSINNTFSGAVAAAGKDFFVTWSDNERVMGARVGAEGRVLEPGAMEIASQGAYANANVGVFGTNILVAVVDVTGAALLRLDFSGRRLGRTALPFNSPEALRHAKFAANSRGFVWVWDDYKTVNQITTGSVNAIRFNDRFEILAPGILELARVTNSLFGISVASDGNNFLAVWDSSTYLAGDPPKSLLRSCLISSNGTMGPVHTIPIPSSNSQYEPKAAFNGTNYLVVWTDERNYPASLRDIYGARVSANGRMLDPAGIPICTNKLDQTGPRVASNGSEFAVVWQDARGTNEQAAYSGLGIYYSIVDSAGHSTPPDGRSLGLNAGGHFSLGASGASFLVVAAANGPVYGRVFDTAGKTSAVMTVGEGPASDPAASFPAVAGNGAEFLVTWSCYDRAGKDYAIYGTRVGVNGVPLKRDSQRLVSTGWALVPSAVASDGEGYLLVWEHVQEQMAPGQHWYDHRVRATRIGPDGGLLDADPIRVSASESQQTNPQVVFDGRGYWVAWIDDREGPNAGTVVYVAELAPDGRPWPGTESHVSPATITGMYGLPYTFALAPGPAGQAALAYMNPVEGVYRVAGRLLSSGPLKVRPGEAVFSWAAKPGVTYRVQYNADLGTTNWLDLPGDVLATSDLASKSDRSITNVPRRFYRVIELR